MKTEPPPLTSMEKGITNGKKELWCSYSWRWRNKIILTPLTQIYLIQERFSLADLQTRTKDEWQLLIRHFSTNTTGHVVFLLGLLWLHIVVAAMGPTASNIGKSLIRHPSSHLPPRPPLFHLLPRPRLRRPPLMSHPAHPFGRRTFGRSTQTGSSPWGEKNRAVTK